MHRFKLPISLAVTLAFVGCTTITEELPTSGPNPVNAPIVLVPAPPPGSVTPTPGPAQSPGTQPPNPTPPPPPSTQSCPLPAGTWNENCSMQSPQFLGQVEAAIDEVIRTNPQIFNLNRTRGGCGNCYEVVDPTRYVNLVTQFVTRNGLCGHYDGEELGVKNTNAFNDQYDILTSDLFIRRQGGAYRSTCRPAWF